VRVLALNADLPVCCRLTPSGMDNTDRRWRRYDTGRDTKIDEAFSRRSPFEAVARDPLKCQLPRS
jgi:hypothetical protein